MVITNYKDKYIRVESDTLTHLFTSPSIFNEIKVTGKRNCDGIAVSQNIIGTVANAGWRVDLTLAVGLYNKVYQTKVKNIFTGVEYDTFSTPIDLAYIGYNCAGTGCTLEDFSSHFAPLFKANIDGFFSSKGVTSNVVITFEGNILVVKSLPSRFVLTVAEYAINVIDEPEEEPFYYATIGGDIIISENNLFISPTFFGDSTLLDGVYQITVKYTKSLNAGFIEESMCAFIDVTTRCAIATFMKQLLSGDYQDEIETLWVLHYALTRGSNCGCNCQDLCDAFKDLIALLNKLISNPNITNTPCGC